MCTHPQPNQQPNPLRATLQRLRHHLTMARATGCCEAARINHLRSASFLADTALWQLDHHPGVVKPS
jgi:hypothetical protein